MSKEVTYSLNDVIKDLGVEIANLKISLATETCARKAFQKRVEELESEKETDNNDSNNHKKK